MNPPERRVAGIILHREGRVLLQHRDDKPGITAPGAWAIFGGHLEPGEEPDNGARREVAEELGLCLEGPLELVHQDEEAGRIRYFYAAFLDVPPAELDLREGQGMALLAPEDLDRYPLVPSHRAILRRFFAERSGR
jgi:8-oxo-dGTP diphosphatase